MKNKINIKINIKSKKIYNGFSVIEVLISLSIILLFNLIVNNNFRFYERSELIRNAIALKNNLRKIQFDSVEKNLKHDVFLYNDKYEIRSYNYDKNILKTEEVYLRKNITLDTNAKNKITGYTQYGTGFNSCTLTLNSKNFELNMTILPATGRVLIKNINKKINIK
ncbi:MAG: hypothetical protein LBJ93_00460 [Clostridiales bacterium]|jgi:hypothetical protein|nr:hypothetical protein [Clostridiales bacterium]